MHFISISFLPTSLIPSSTQAIITSFLTMPSPASIIFLVFSLMSTISAAFLNPPLSTPRALNCGHSHVDPSLYEAFSSNFQAAMNSVLSQSMSQGYARVVKRTSTDDIVFAFGECIEGISQTECDRCLTDAKSQLSQCLHYPDATTGGRIYLDSCYLRYDDHDFFQETLSLPDKLVDCRGKDFDGDQDDFIENTNELIKTLITNAPTNNGFSTGSVDKGNSSVYGLVQCWRFVNTSLCRDCLEYMRWTMTHCLPKQEWRLMTSICYMRYSTQQFYHDSASDNMPRKSGGNLAFASYLISSVVAVIMVTLLIICICNGNWPENKEVKEQQGPLTATVNRSNPNFEYKTLQRATNNFSNSNKLGEGGSSAVFKGVLLDGTVVAVKKLLFHTTEWLEQFFNEIDLVSSINHKNLVKLLGWSITGTESLLVYEYMPNGSLQNYISDQQNRWHLTWEMRYNIIVGVAEGLAYLHEESELRIIHRDIKLSNVLLDEKYNAKIADFGLAKLYPKGKTHLRTNLAGTMGYMAPEYVVRGILTEKADVFSFGVLMIEVITGKRVSYQPESPLSLLQRVWDLYTSRRLAEAVDAVVDSFAIDKACRALQVGLLCAQASAKLRPSMSMVVAMLKGDEALPSPNQPPYLRSRESNSLAAPGTSSPGPEPFSKSPANS